MSSLDKTTKKQSSCIPCHLPLYQSRTSHFESNTPNELRNNNNISHHSNHKPPFNYTSPQQPQLLFLCSVVSGIRRPCCQRPLMTEKSILVYQQQIKKQARGISHLEGVNELQGIQQGCFLYVMPCGHNICMDCINQMIAKGQKCIKCLKRICQRNYSLKEANSYFIKNQIIMKVLSCIAESDLWKKLAILFRARKQIENVAVQQKNQQQLQEIRRCNIFKNYEPKNTQINYSFAEGHSFENQCNNLPKNSELSSSSQECFNECLNIFCKKPTSAFFCSLHCQNFYQKIHINS